MKFLDPDHPMFRRPWVRWVCVLLPLGWSGLEFWWQEPFWAILFGALGVYAAKVLIFNGK